MNNSSGSSPATRSGNVYRRHALVGTSILLMLQQCCHPVNAFSLSWTAKNHPKQPKTAQKRRSNMNSRLFDTPPEQEPRSIPPMMSGINGDNSTTTTVVNGLSTSHDFFVNGSGGEKANGAVLEEISSSKNGETEDRHKSVSPTAPEVKNWTSIMVKGIFYKKKQMETVDQVYKDLRDMSKFDCEQVDRYWDQLMPTVSYLGTEQVAKIYDALRVGYRAHRGQMRKSGEPYIIHPVEVALLLAGLKMDGETVMAGLLHDTVEDTNMTFDLIEGMFGKVVRSIVEGETKVSKLPKLAFSDYADEQAENLRQMFVAMTDDYRIIIVKLADRLHNMRTLRHMKPEKQIKISRETLEIFAPLAHRMGIWQFKSELEDTSFMYLYPQEYKRLNRRLRQHQKKFRDTLDKSQELLAKRLSSDSTLRDQAFEVKVSGRTKEIYSLWHKMETKGERDLDHIVDVVALRVVITPKATEGEDENDTPDRGVWLCYHVLGLVQHLPGFQPVPTRVKDYISFPKPNGYQSLHTALILNGQTIEVQIRTSMMHQIAEYGMASHWAYTDGKKRTNGGLYNTPWLSSIKEWQNDILSARDFVDSVRSELLGKRVFVFLRNGKILNLARGATAIDAAFQIHTEVGLTMHGVEINGKPVPISYELRNGDVVSVLTGGGKPSTDWMRYAKSRSTRSKLRSYFRSKQRESLREAGEILLKDYLWMHGPLIEKYSYIEEPFIIPSTAEEVAALLPGNTQYEDIDDLLITIGKQHDRATLHSFFSKLFKVPLRVLVDTEKDGKSVIPQSVFDAVHESRRRAKDAAAAAAPDEFDDDDDIDTKWPKPASSSSTTHREKAVSNTFDGNMEYADLEHVCEDCLPIFGDEIVGTKPENSPDSTPKVHRFGCPHAMRAINRALADKRPSAGIFDFQRVDSVTLRRSKKAFTPASVLEVPVKLQWPDFSSPEEQDGTFQCEVVVHAQDRKLLLADCSEIVSELSEITKTGSQTTKEHATLVFLVNVQSLSHLQKLMDSLGQVRAVMSAERRFGSELL